MAQETVTIDLRHRYQLFEGWGTSLAWWAVVTGGWSDPQRTALADLLFSPQAGLGLSVVRYNIGGGENPTHHHMRPGGAVPGYSPRRDLWDWGADAAQRWMLQAALQRGATIAEAFSNAPPYWMTRSGCSGGADDRGDNLKEDEVVAFATYLATVVGHLRNTWGVTFRTLAPFNEPLADHWHSGRDQEGCHVSVEQQRRVVAALSTALRARGLTETGISIDDAFRIDDLVTTFTAYDPATQAAVAQLNTHSYSGTQRAQLAALAAAHGKRLWMSEYGTSVGPHDHAAMATPLALSAQIRRDLSALRPAAWIYWQAIENEAGHNWGLIHADFTGGSERYALTRSYHAFGQYTRFIRPGSRFVASSGAATLAAYHAGAQRLTVVYENATPMPIDLTLDLPHTAIGAPIAVYRTSPTEEGARQPDLSPWGGRAGTILRRLSPLPLPVVSVQIPAQSLTTFVFDGVS